MFNSYYLKEFPKFLGIGISSFICILYKDISFLRTIETTTRQRNNNGNLIDLKVSFLRGETFQELTARQYIKKENFLKVSLKVSFLKMKI